MKQVLQVTHIIVSLGLITLILLQTKGAGLTTILGGGGEIFRTKRGMEKIIFILTIILAILFALTSLANVAIS